jgi:hypothetical protein
LRERGWIRKTSATSVSASETTVSTRPVWPVAPAIARLKRPLCRRLGSSRRACRAAANAQRGKAARIINSAILRCCCE